MAAPRRRQSRTAASSTTTADSSQGCCPARRTLAPPAARARVPSAPGRRPTAARAGTGAGWSHRGCEPPGRSRSWRASLWLLAGESRARSPSASAGTPICCRWASTTARRSSAPRTLSLGRFSNSDRGARFHEPSLRRPSGSVEESWAVVSDPRCNAGVVVRDDHSDGTRHGRQARDPARLRPRSLHHFLQVVRLGIPRTYSRRVLRGGCSSEAGPFRIRITEWSGRRGSNLRPLPWQGMLLILYSDEAKIGF